MNHPYSRPPLSILLVEDNPGDARLIMEALKESRVRNHVNVVHDGAAAIDYLRHQATFADTKRPDLILLDLNLPRKNGREVLAEIKRDPALLRIPVIVLTTSDAEQDILSAYDLHANCYIIKPMALDEVMDVVTSIEDFWFMIARIPSQ